MADPDEEELYLSVQSDFVYFWCKEYGLPELVVRYLDKSGYRRGGDLLTSWRDLDRQILSADERFLLRGAIEQYRLHRRVVDEVIQEKMAVKKVEMISRARQAIRKAKSDNLPEEAALAKRILMKPDLFEEIRKKRENEEKVRSEEQVSQHVNLADSILKRREQMGIRCESAPVLETGSSGSSQFPASHPGGRSATSTPGLLHSRHRLRPAAIIPRQHATPPPVEYVQYKQLPPDDRKGNYYHKQDKTTMVHAEQPGLLPNGVEYYNDRDSVVEGGESESARDGGDKNLVYMEYETLGTRADRGITDRLQYNSSKGKTDRRKGAIKQQYRPALVHKEDTDVIIELE